MFELSYQEHAANAKLADEVYTLKEWRVETKLKYEAMKQSPHWHNGVPCRMALGCKFCKRDQAFEE
jgi:hypothetical protein